MVIRVGIEHGRGQDATLWKNIFMTSPATVPYVGMDLESAIVEQLIENFHEASVLGNICNFCKQSLDVDCVVGNR